MSKCKEEWNTILVWNNQHNDFLGFTTQCCRNVSVKTRQASVSRYCNLQFPLAPISRVNHKTLERWKIIQSDLGHNADCFVMDVQHQGLWPNSLWYKLDKQHSSSWILQQFDGHSYPSMDKSECNENIFRNIFKDPIVKYNPHFVIRT